LRDGMKSRRSGSAIVEVEIVVISLKRKRGYVNKWMTKKGKVSVENLKKILV